MRDLDLTTLRLFVYVCESGSLAKASERAAIVSSAISKRLAQLEERLGTPLIVRKGYGVVPTTAGQTLLEHARAVFDNVARIEEDMRNYAGGAHGQARLFASASICERLAADVVTFIANPGNRNIHVDVEERMTPGIVRGVQQGLASLGICWDAGSLGELKSRAYCTDRFCVVVPRGHALARHRKVRFADTLEYEQAGLPVTSATQQLLQRMASQTGHTLIQRIVVSTFESAVRVAHTGAAICVAPRELAEPLADAYQLRLLELVEDWATRRFVICFRDEKALTPAAKLLLDHLSAMHADA